MLARETFALEVGARSAGLNDLPESVAVPSDPRSEYLEVRGADGTVAHWYFAEDTTLRLAGDAYTATVTTTEDGYDVTVTATALAKDLALFPDRLDPAARVDTCLITLSAGDSHTFHVTGTKAPADVAVPVLRSANDLVS